jgi:hypothetical protein
MQESKFLEEIRAEGARMARREDILRLLRRRFGRKAAAALEAPLNAVDDLERLGRLLDLLADRAPLDDLRRALGMRGTRRC